MQIRTRLTIQFIVLVAGILLLALYFIYFQFKQMTEDELFSSLRSKALMTAEMILHDEDKLEVLDNKTPESNTLPFKDNVIIFNQQWQKIFAFNRNDKGIDKEYFQNNKKEVTLREGNNYIVGVKFISKKGNPYFIVAESKLNIYQVDNLRNILVLTFFIIIFLVAIGGWIYTGQALAPVAKIVSQVDNILPSNLEARLSTPKSKDEIGRLVGTFNKLLDRIQNAFTLQKNFISNVSHELKNPLTIIVSQIEVLFSQEERTKEEYKETLKSVLNDTLELSATTNNLLQLARLHTVEHQKPIFEHLRLDELLLITRQNLIRMHKDYKIGFDIVGTPQSENDLCIYGNEMLLRSLFTNLLDNGCKYSNNKSADVRILINTNESIKVEIEDNGEGIALEDLQKLFQPFYRDPKHKHIKGTGIGLSLVDSILKLHEIPLEIRKSESNGTVFQLDFSNIRNYANK